MNMLSDLLFNVALMLSDFGFLQAADYIYKASLRVRKDYKKEKP